MRPRWFLCPILVVVLLGSATACAPESGQEEGPQDDPEPSPAEVEGDLVVSDQTTDGTWVDVVEVKITTTDGVVAIRADDGGDPGRVLGRDFVSEGRTETLRVTLDEAITSGTYWAVLHRDAGVRAVFEFPEPDTPVLEEDGEVVGERFELDVDDPTPGP